MRRFALLAASTAIFIAGCSESERATMSSPGEYAEAVAADASAEVEELAAEAVADAPQDQSAKEGAPSSDGSAQSTPATSAPQIAYVYDYGFRIEADEIAELAQSHVDLCEKLGPKDCRVISLRQSGSEGSYGSGELELAVASSKARAFGEDLGEAAEGLGGEQINVAISGEDLSKQIVDTEARLRARTLLRDRLMEVLRSRRGTVAELVEAERGVAQVNEEIDQSRSWLNEMRGRVAFSRVSIDYNSSSRTGDSFSRPIVEAFQSIGTVLGTTIGILIYALTVLIPIALLVFGLRWALHQFGLRLRFWKKDEPNNDPAEGSEKS
ncbi:MAG: DUF4349 domain-containing protein [Erythrobacter sp.]